MYLDSAKFLFKNKKVTKQFECHQSKTYVSPKFK